MWYIFILLFFRILALENIAKILTTGPRLHRQLCWVISYLLNPAGVDIRILSALARGWGVGGNLKFSVAYPPGFELAQGGKLCCVSFQLAPKVKWFSTIENCRINCFFLRVWSNEGFIIYLCVAWCTGLFTCKGSHLIICFTTNVDHYRAAYVAQSVTCLATDASLTADPGVASSIPARYHIFVEIDHEISYTVILLPSAESFKKGCCQLQGKVCARITG